MASIDKRPNGKWRARWREYPGGPQKTRTFSRKIDAADFLASIDHGLRSGTYVDPDAGRITLDKLWAGWHSARSDLRPKSIARNEVRWRLHISPALGSMPISAIDRPMLREWVAAMTAGGMAPSGVRKAVHAVRQVLEVAVEDRLIAANPADGLRGLPKTPPSEARFCTPAEVRRLIAAAPQQWQPWFATAAWSGLRFGELAGLRRRNLDLDNARITVIDTITEMGGTMLDESLGKTAAARRRVPLPAHVVDLLAVHAAEMAGDDLVFTGPEGGPIRGSLFHPRVWQPAVMAAGLGGRVPVAPENPDDDRTRWEGLRPHDLRHTAVSLWITAGADLMQLKRWAGHRSVATLVDTYGHLMPDREDAVVAALDRLAAPSEADNVILLRTS